MDWVNSIDGDNKKHTYWCLWGSLILS